MFSDKNFNLPKELIEASKRIMEQKAIAEEEVQLSEEDEALFEAFEEFLEENFHVDQLTEEEVDYLLDMFLNEKIGGAGATVSSAWQATKGAAQAAKDKVAGLFKGGSAPSSGSAASTPNVTIKTPAQVKAGAGAADDAAKAAAPKAAPAAAPKAAGPTAGQRVGGLVGATALGTAIGLGAREVARSNAQPTPRRSGAGSGSRSGAAGSGSSSGSGDGWKPDSSSRPGGLADPTRYQ